MRVSGAGRAVKAASRASWAAWRAFWRGSRGREETRVARQGKNCFSCGWQDNRTPCGHFAWAREGRMRAKALFCWFPVGGLHVAGERSSGDYPESSPAAGVRGETR